MNKNSTQQNLLKQFSQIKTKNSDNRPEENLKVKDDVIRNILAYSKSVKSIKTSTIGDVLIVNN